MHSSMTDSTLAVLSASGTALYTTQGDPTANPIISQVLIPLLAGVLVPLFKELSISAIEKIKENRKKRKK